MLSVKGNQIVDEDGKEVLLRGVSGAASDRSMLSLLTRQTVMAITHTVRIAPTGPSRQVSEDG